MQLIHSTAAWQGITLAIRAVVHSTSHRHWKTLAGSQQLMPAVKLMWLEQVLKAKYCLSWWWYSNTDVIHCVQVFLNFT